MTKALLVPADETEPARLVDLPDPMLAEVWKLVDGHIQSIGNDTWHAYINDDGKSLGLPANHRGEKLARSLGFEFLPFDYLVGAAVFLGPADEHGGETDVPEFVIDRAHDLGVLLPDATDKAIRVTFERIGRDHHVDPLVIQAGRTPDQLAKAIFYYARPKLRSQNVNVVVDLERMGGTIFCGFHVGGSFTLQEITEEDE